MQQRIGQFRSIPPFRIPTENHVDKRQSAFRPVLRFQLYLLKLPTGELASVMAQLTGEPPISRNAPEYFCPANFPIANDLDDDAEVAEVHLSVASLPGEKTTLP
ncbi:hypothetical protein K0M31_001557 [Melipona bicolor]|uniref:Uncharacterized protein n=1 Tax=Melipona bicolor TaxID=60889 RepID=A0AA40KXQ6_9HYME|nr:hypothetical protein K0M31_001557 [Melipona bicolor]